ncbi:MAG: phosphoribosylaminoimidazolesuccinocarboxamide synthase, partial [Cyanobium sp.]
MTAPSIGPLLHEGKAKRVHATDRPDVVAVEYKDDATAFNALKKASLPGKGALNCRISSLLFEHLEDRGIPTHFLGVIDTLWMAVRPVKVIPIEVVVRNIAAGSLCRQLPVAAGAPLDPPLIDLYYKDDTLGDPLRSEERLHRLDLVSDGQLATMRSLALSVNRELRQLFRGVGLERVDFKIELGCDSEGRILLADEISPDTCRLWDLGTADTQARILDKDRFRQDLGGVV